ncbi:hypothetical protein FRC14_000520 [Serendipita sp. 396]|nr:hypothetical protein FRC14_000520 [Serendipita sp. 396]KAG8788374.1 hypothetical protein FRC15_004654 [Serendipita sp. 397]KAG8803391.1 hypothetical protein FRC16_005588 [Serendipita sp. 398]KAG8855806.1 hypothetical protein FRC20_000686 [Serendipita sp. 405]KAG8860739.1 hypothetical protein FRB91_001003 [Serendipita sp. 411]
MTTSQNDEIWSDRLDNHAERSWNKMEDDFTNVGYREGITKGKEDALQEGFDDGFATVGVPLGRQIGILRGVVAGLLVASRTKDSPLSQLSTQRDLDTLRERLEMLSRRLNSIRLKDIAPRDLQAEAHAREHRDVEKEGTDDALAEAFEELSTTNQLDKSQEIGLISNELRGILESLKIKLPFQL